MPSRKKAKGKARKAAKEAEEAEAKEEESHAAVEVAAGQGQVQDESLEAQLQRLGINAKLCKHGCDALLPDDQKICEDFIAAFTAVCRSSQSGDLVERFSTAENATKNEYPSVYSSKLDTVVSILLCSGTEYILKKDKQAAGVAAMYASYFEEYIAVRVHETKATVNWTKTFEMLGGDDHTIVSYLRKRIPCGCLDQRYKEVKSMKKMGMCFNPSCSQPRSRAERSKMFYCTRCGEANYCSVECQKADWKYHKQFCDKSVEMKAMFDSDETKLLSTKKWPLGYVARLLEWLLIAMWNTLLIAIWATVLGVEFPDAVVCFVSWLPL